ncbi:hypothetical protein L226DRAFT_474064 [Lentinus tigrinus ALCF2SS1-7]|uniref:DUF659 domain-containing protein n=1 Tax=Lentinus tigrinus ALCF2SS1-6 TaxID=1328759 RepID=A0A5C2RQI1_9APHY|nr:hypothetical protein L227DRAFT_514458 [Lentinus tigrinus ALCF2SS1-6]RPD68012.1 hypothetical protein L226DRAFT_474064 [Lentinus tigrinus ALCF2SS1-7]
MDSVTRSRVWYLRHLLRSLPHNLPFKDCAASAYRFQHLDLDREWIESEGIEAAANRALEVRLGPRTGPRETFIIKERGPGLEALADVLEVHIGKFPNDICFRKWLEDACRAAENTFTDANEEVLVDRLLLGSKTSKASKNMKSKASASSTSSQKTTMKTKKKKRDEDMLNEKRPATNKLESFEDPAFISSDEEEDNRMGGAKLDPLLKRAARVHVELTSQLSKIRDLTLSFDGGKTRRPRGIYTITVTTPARQGFLYDLQNVSKVSHTAEYILEFLEPVVLKLGPSNFSATVSDNTGNTRKACELLTAKFPHILNFQDCCHEINLALLQINDLDEFKEVCVNPSTILCSTCASHDVKDILTYMHKSTYSMEHFDDARTQLGISHGLVKIGKTRFSTYVSAVSSIKRCLPAFEKITCNEALPFARAIKCLESAHSTPSDVYVFWLAIMATLERRFIQQRIHLPIHTIESIRAIANQRFNELIEEGPDDKYIAAFFLDIRMQNSSIFWPHVPLMGLCFSLGWHPASLLNPPSNPLAVPPRMLKREYGDTAEMLDHPKIQEIMKARNPRLADYDPSSALEAVKTELQAYAKREKPFDRSLRPGETMRDWWVKVQKKEGAHVLGALGIKLFSVVPNSMIDERIMSTVTWLNSPKRARQHVKTLRDHIKIRQWDMYDGIDLSVHPRIFQVQHLDHVVLTIPLPATYRKNR